MFRVVCGFNLIRLCVINWIIAGTACGTVLCNELFELRCLSV